MPNANSSLATWLKYLKKSEIKLGLARINTVYKKLIPQQKGTVITITGTNGKGSTAAFLESIYLSANYSVGKLSSPELLKYNEQISINGSPATNKQICRAFDIINNARGDIALSYFEFLTLSALLIFADTKVSIIILEVGLGGRLDAANVVDCDCAVITNITLDHCNFLGNSRDDIASEKIAIARMSKPLLCSDNKPPKSMLTYIIKHKIPTTFVKSIYNGKIGLAGKHQRINAQLAKITIKTLTNKHPVSIKNIIDGIKQTNILGRIQHIKQQNINFILDVAHNEAASVALLAHIKTLNCTAENTAIIFSALKDKNIAAIVGKISPLITNWHLLNIDDARFDMQDLLIRTTQTLNTQTCNLAVKYSIINHTNIADAIDNIKKTNISNIVVFGSFHTVAQALKYLKYA